jgi:hypothetical protein
MRMRSARWRADLHRHALLVQSSDETLPGRGDRLQLVRGYALQRTIEADAGFAVWAGRLPLALGALLQQDLVQGQRVTLSADVAALFEISVRAAAWGSVPLSSPSPISHRRGGASDRIDWVNQCDGYDPATNYTCRCCRTRLGSRASGHPHRIPDPTGPAGSVPGAAATTGLCRVGPHDHETPLLALCRCVLRAEPLHWRGQSSNN